MRSTLIAFIVMALGTRAVSVAAAESSFAQKPVVTKDGDTVKISFSLLEATDVEISIVDTEGQTVRHLAAGALGAANPSPAPLQTGLSQNLEWDRKDDFGEEVKGGPFSVRVRAGMGVKLEKIVGGDQGDCGKMGNLL